MEKIVGLVTREKKVAFMQCAGATGGVFTRMKNFTSMSGSANPNEYSRKYVDQPSEDTDVTGYSRQYSYAFDQYTDNAVHQDIIDVTDNEKVGDDAVRQFLIVDFTQPTDESMTQFKAKLRTMSIIPSSDGDDENTYTYSGDFKNKGVAKDVIVTSDDEFELTCKILEGTTGGE